MPSSPRLEWVLRVLVAGVGRCHFLPSPADIPDVTVEQFGTTISEISVSIGARLSLNCLAVFATTTPSDINYLWQKNGSTVAGPGSIPEFTITNLQTSDGGVYRCGVTIDCGSDRETAYSANVVVNTPAVITQLIDANMGVDSTTVTVGDSFELACYAEGFPLPSIEWLHPSGSLVATGNTYINPSASLSDSGEYTCRAVNANLDTETHTVLVK